MSEKMKEEIDLFKEKIKKEGEELVLKKFPRKILELNILTNSEKFSPNTDPKPSDINLPIIDLKSLMKSGDTSNVKQINSNQNSVTNKDLVEEDNELIIVKPFLFPNGRVGCNQLFIEMIDELKPRMIDLSEDIILLKLAISLMVPKMEDGNNFGVEIQQETIDAISLIEKEVLSDFDQFSTYFESRGDLIVKVSKFPHNQDFRIGVEERDTKFHLSLCLTMSDIRNYYVALHDLVTKNLNKIKKPRNNDNKEFLY